VLTFFLEALSDASLVCVWSVASYLQLSHDICRIYMFLGEDESF